MSIPLSQRKVLGKFVVAKHADLPIYWLGFMQTGKVEVRINGMQGQLPFKIELVGVSHRAYQQDVDMQKALADDCVNGSWFRATDAVLAEVAKAEPYTWNPKIVRAYFGSYVKNPNRFNGRKQLASSPK